MALGAEGAAFGVAAVAEALGGCGAFPVDEATAVPSAFRLRDFGAVGGSILYFVVMMVYFQEMVH